MRITRKDTLLSSMALDMLIEGNKAYSVKNIDSALQFYATAWGFNCSQEYIEGMKVCDELLGMCEIDQEELEEWHKYGIEMVDFAINLNKAVDNVFGIKSLFEFNPPKI